MKKVVTVQEVEGEGFMALLGKRVLLFCGNYFYTGTLEGVNEECVLLTDASIVYETGAFTDSKFKDSQKLPFPVYIQKSFVESFTETLNK